jgi:N-acetylmuramoyl-L-alanine amidase
MQKKQASAIGMFIKSLSKIALAAVCAAAFFAAPAQARKHAPRKAAVVHASSEMDEIQVSVDGDFKGAVQVLREKGQLYIDGKGAARLLGGSGTLKGGRLELKLKNMKVQMRSGSREAGYAGKTKTMPAAMLVRGDKPFVPVELFTAAEFAAGIGRSVTYNDIANSLDIDKVYQVGEMDYYSYGPMTTVSFELHGVNSYTTVQSSPSVIDIIIPGAVAQSYETVALNDGIIDSVAVVKNDGGVKISLNLLDSKAQWNTSRDASSLTIEVTRAPKETVVPSVAPVAALGTASSAKKPQQPVARPVAQLPAAATPQARLNIPDAIVAAPKAKRRIVIDPGHGGKDPGGSNRRKITEKILNLQIATALGELFEDNPVFDATLTRTTDFFIPLDGRCAIANDSHADVFVSIHANANRHKSERGFEVYFMSENATDPWAREVAANENSVQGLEDNTNVPPEGLLLHSLARTEYMNESALLAGSIADALAKTSPIKDRGVKQAPFYVLRGTYAPAVLVETGFMTNSKEADLLNSKKVQLKIAQGIFDGVMNYAKSKGWVQDK